MNTNPDHKHLEQPMFFGEDTGVARYEEQKHRVFETLTEKQLSFFWRPEEVDLSIDRMQYAKMPEHEKSFSIQTCNIKPCWIPFRGAPEPGVPPYRFRCLNGNVDRNMGVQ